jgi:O-antigen ligase
MSQTLKSGNGHLGAPLPKAGQQSPAMLLTLVLGGALIGAFLFYAAYSSGSIFPVLAVFGGVLGCVVMARVFPSVKEKVTGLAGKLRWWHGLWFLVYFSGLVFREGRDASAVAAAPLDATALLRVIPEMFVAAVLLIRLYMKRPFWLRSYFQGVLGAMGVYTVVCLVSTVWSVYAPWTLFKSGEYAIYIALLAAIIQLTPETASFATILNLTWTISVMEMLWAWVQTIIWPADAWDPWGRITSVFPQISANGMAQSCAVVATIAACRLLPLERGKRDRMFYSIAFALALGTLIMTKTRNSIAGFLLAMVLLIVLSRRWRFAFEALIVGGAGLVVIGALMAVLRGPGAVAAVLNNVGDTIYNFLARGQTQEEMVGMSSRMDWWTFAFQQFMKHPITGMGAYAGSRFGVLAKMGADAPTSLHSDYIETIMGTSFLGLIPLLTAIGGIWYWLLRSVRSALVTAEQRQLAYECACVFVVTVLHSFFNVEIIWQSPMTYLCVLGAAEHIRRSRKGAIAGFSRSMAAGRS